MPQSRANWGILQSAPARCQAGIVRPAAPGGPAGSGEKFAAGGVPKEVLEAPFRAVDLQSEPRWFAFLRAARAETTGHAVGKLVHGIHRIAGQGAQPFVSFDDVPPCD